MMPWQQYLLKNVQLFPNLHSFAAHVHKQVSMTIGERVRQNEIIVDGVLPGRCGATEEKCFIIGYSNAGKRLESLIIICSVPTSSGARISSPSVFPTAQPCSFKLKTRQCLQLSSIEV